MALSLASIMDEELARKLQEEEDRFIKDEFEYYEQFDQTNESFPQDNTQNFDVYSCSSIQEEQDLLYALKLQRELELEERNNSQRGKISVSTHSDYYRQKEQTQKNTQLQNLSGYIYQEQQEEDEEWEEQKEMEAQTKKQERKPHGRRNYTKHDPILSGRKNAFRTEERGIETGNLVDSNQSPIFSLSNDKTTSNTSQILLSNPVSNSLRQFALRQEGRRIRYHGKEEISSHEQVFDKKTRILIQKMLNKGRLTHIYGVISTGKEANVYPAWYSAQVDLEEEQEKERQKLLRQQARLKKKEEREKELQRKKIKKLGQNGQKLEPTEPTSEEERELEEEDESETDEWYEGNDSEKANAEAPKNQPEKEPTEAKVCCVLKIYKTTLNEFKNREKYMVGDYRFKNKMSHMNPRKLIKQWAEKEYGNLSRIYLSSDIPVPRPLYLKKNILVLSFVGSVVPNSSTLVKDDTNQLELIDQNDTIFIPAPKLGEVIKKFSMKKRFQVYFEVLIMMRKLYQRCKLVHGDLSEFNLLYHNNLVYVIDVSQSMDVESENALEFLKRDCWNITKFFSSHLEPETKNNQKETEHDTKTPNLHFVLPLVELFKFVTDSSLQDDMVGEYLTKLKERVTNPNWNLEEETLRESVFMKTHTASKLSDLGDISHHDDNDHQFYFHQTVTGLREDMSGPINNVPELLEEQINEYELENDSDSDSDSE